MITCAAAASAACGISPGGSRTATACPRDTIQSLRDQGATLMITVDCGITGNEEVDYAASIGLDVVITDHHECKEELPAAVAVVDPHRGDCAYPFKHLAGGVAWR